MSAGMYVSASGALTSMHRLDVASNNLANVNTTAFKKDFAFQTPRLPERLEDSLFNLGSDELLDQLAGGVLSDRIRTDFSPASSSVTNNPLDAAIDGEGFFVVESNTGEPWLTRDGRFTIDAGGTLVSATSGQPVLSAADTPITINSNLPVTLSPRGEVLQQGRAVARLKLVNLDDTASLKKTLGGFYTSKFGTPLNLENNPDIRIRPEALENSGIDPVKALMAVTSAGGGVRNNLKLMQLYDDLDDRAINRLGSVSG